MNIDNTKGHRYLYNALSTVTKASSDHNTLRTVIPRPVAQMCNITEGAKLQWSVLEDNKNKLKIVIDIL